MSIWESLTFVRKGNYLNGSFVKLPDVDGYINSVNPGNLEDRVGRFPFTRSAVAPAVGFSRDAFPAWHKTRIEARAEPILRLRAQLAENIDLVAWTIARETGKPRWEAHAEVLATIKRIDVTLEEGAPLLQGWRPPGLAGGCEFHPRGVVAVLGTYAMPLLSPVAHIVPALLAGNTVILKPSKYVPAVGQIIAELMDRARFPRGVFGMILGNGKSVGARLADHRDVDALHLDGALETAQQLRKRLLRQPWKRQVFNACGRGTAIVLDDADLDKAAYEVAYGACLTAGQRRSSTARVIVTRKIADTFVDRLAQGLDSMRIGNGLTEEVFLGPLVSETARRRFLAYVRSVAKAGHEVIRKGERVRREPGGYYVRPSLVRIDPGAWRTYPTAEDIVGPALEVFVADDFDDALSIHNRSISGLVTSVFTQSRSLVEEARYQLRVGNVNWNRATVIISARLPLDGQRASGSGAPMGIFAVRTCAYPMSFVEDTRPFDPETVMPGIQWPRLDHSETGDHNGDAGGLEDEDATLIDTERFRVLEAPEEEPGRSGDA